MQSLLTSLSLGATTFGNLLAASLVKRTGTRPLILSGYISIFIGCGLAALTHTISLIVIAQLFIGLSLGVAYPVLMGMSIIKVEEAERATAMGLFHRLCHRYVRRAMVERLYSRSHRFCSQCWLLPVLPVCY
jgi:MFS family permease